jgi:hypothetical protein
LPGERTAFDAVAGLGVDTVEDVLLYHVAPGATIDRKAALKADGVELSTALGATVEVDVKRCWYGRQVRLVDADTSDGDARVVRYDINKGNKPPRHRTRCRDAGTAGTNPRRCGASC